MGKIEQSGQKFLAAVFKQYALDWGVTKKNMAVVTYIFKSTRHEKCA